MPLATFVSLIPPRGFAAPTGDAKKGFALIKTAGRSMIEMLGVLAIIGVLSAGGIMGYSAAMENYRVNKTIEDISNALAQAQNIFTGNQSISSFDVNTLKRLKLMPENYKNLGSAGGCWMGDNCVETPIGLASWGYEYATKSEVWESLGIVAPAANLWLAFENRSERICIKLLTTANWTQFSNFTSIAPWNGNSRTLSGDFIPYKPITVAEAKHICSNGNRITIAIFFRGRFIGTRMNE